MYSSEHVAEVKGKYEGLRAHFENT